MPRPNKLANPFPCFHFSSEVIRLAFLMHVQFPRSLRNVGDPLHKRCVDLHYETVRLPYHERTTVVIELK